MRKKKSTNSECCRRCGKKGTLLHCWWEYKLVQPLWKTVRRFLRKLKIRLPYDPAIPLLGICLEKMKTLIWKDTCTPMFIAALFTIGKMWKQQKGPSKDDWLKKMWYIHMCVYIHIYIYMYVYIHTYIYVYIYNGLLLSHKK